MKFVVPVTESWPKFSISKVAEIIITCLLITPFDIIRWLRIVIKIQSSYHKPNLKTIFVLQIEQWQLLICNL